MEAGNLYKFRQSIEEFNVAYAENELLVKLQEAENAVKDGNGWLDLSEVKALVDDTTEPEN